MGGLCISSESDIPKTQDSGCLVLFSQGFFNPIYALARLRPYPALDRNYCPFRLESAIHFSRHTNRVRGP
jgi:hypothetical protein